MNDKLIAKTDLYKEESSHFLVSKQLINDEHLSANCRLMLIYLLSIPEQCLNRIKINIIIERAFGLPPALTDLLINEAIANKYLIEAV